MYDWCYLFDAEIIACFRGVEPHQQAHLSLPTHKGIGFPGESMKPLPLTSKAIAPEVFAVADWVVEVLEMRSRILIPEKLYP
jgi:hypothetical protein